MGSFGPTAAKILIDFFEGSVETGEAVPQVDRQPAPLPEVGRPELVRYCHSRDAHGTVLVRAPRPRDPAVHVEPQPETHVYSGSHRPARPFASRTTRPLSSRVKWNGKRSIVNTFGG